MRGREPVKRDLMVSFLRNGIVAGAWKPGELLPPRSWFERRFEAASHTVQNAFRELLDAEFLLAERRLGTRVHPDPPHLRRYALLLGGELADGNRRTRALCAAAEQWQQRGCDWRLHFELSRPADDPARQALLAKIRHHGYAGVFLESPPPEGAHSPFFQFEGIPVTGFFGPECERPPEVVACSRPPGGAPGDAELEFQLVRALVEAGVRRPAMLLCASGHDEEREQRLRRRIAEAGMSCPPGYLLEFRPEALIQSRNVLQLLLAGHNRLRPDGLALADDRFLPYVAEVLAESAGEPAWKQLKLVSAGHYPALPRFGLPIRFIGLDLVRTLENAQHFIDERRAGRTAVPPRRVRFEPPQNHLHRETEP